MSQPEIKYRPASAMDNSQLLELTRKSGMSGDIALRTDRDPDFFALVKMRGPGEVFVALDGDRIVGSISVTRETVWMDEKKHPLFYISDFKVSPGHRNQGIGFQLTREVVRFLEDNDADFALLHVAKGNKRPFVFFSDRDNYPDFENIGIFTIYQYFGKNKRIRNPAFTFKTITPTDEILNFINACYRRYYLAPFVTPAALEGVNLTGVYKNGVLKAVFAIATLDEVKQNVVLKIPFYLQLFRGFMNLIRPLTGTVKIPGVNEPIRMLHLKFLVLEEIQKDLIQAIFNKVQHEAYQKNYPFVSLSLHQRDPLRKAIPGKWRIPFHSVGMLVSMKNSRELMAKIHKGVPFKDFSTV